MSARSGSLGWVAIAGLVSLGIAGAMWGVLDSQFISTLVATDSWSAADGSTLQLGREYVLRTWRWLLLIVLLRVGLEALVASRLTGASTQLPIATLVLIAVHVLLVLWMVSIPEMAQPMYQLATNEYSSALAALPGTQSAVEIGYEYGVGILPAVLLVVADGWYLTAPIREDLLRRGV